MFDYIVIISETKGKRMNRMDRKYTNDVQSESKALCC